MGWDRRVLVATAWVLAAAVVGSCDGEPSLDFDTFRADVTELECAFRYDCGAACNLDACHAMYDRHFDRLAARMSASVTEFDETAAALCVEALQQIVAQGCRNAGDAYTEASELCQLPFVGTVDDGGQCFFNEDCVSRWCSRSPDCVTGCCEGICQPVPVEPPPAGIGESCLSASCVDGAYCKDHVCVPHLPLGAECELYDICAVGTCAGGVCTAVPDLGEPCTPSQLPQCLSVRTDYCDPVEYVCKPRPRVGEACGPGIDFCVTCASCQEGVCQSWPGPGEPCTGMCAIGLVCQDGICAFQVDYSACTD